jgi:hypothetical protein
MINYQQAEQSNTASDIILTRSGDDTIGVKSTNKRKTPSICKFYCRPTVIVTWYQLVGMVGAK